MPISLGIPDNEVTLGNYSPELLTCIKKRSWKFWVLEYIAQNKTLAWKLRQLWIFVEGIHPTILEPSEEVTDDFFARINTATNQLPDFIKPYIISDTTFHVRWWSPGDFKGLVDTIHTDIIQQATRNKIGKAISRIRGNAYGNSEDIARYARSEWVFWDPAHIQIWVVPSLSVPIVTVTEDPNRDGRIFIDTQFPTHSWERYMSSGDYLSADWKKEETHSESTWEMSEFEKALALLASDRGELDKIRKKNIPDGKNIYTAIALLKKMGVLDPNMTYQFEFGWLEWNLNQFVLFQVKEFAKKNPVSTDDAIKDMNSYRLKWITYGHVSRIITGLQEWDILQAPILDWQGRGDIWEDLRNAHNSPDFVMRPRMNRDDLQSGDYHRNIRWFIHGDAHGWTLAHNSFRFAQSVVRKWWIIVLGSDAPYADKNPDKDTLHMQVRRGKLEAIWTIRPADDSPDALMRQLDILLENGPKRIVLPRKKDAK